MATATRYWNGSNDAQYANKMQSPCNEMPNMAHGMIEMKLSKMAHGMFVIK